MAERCSANLWRSLAHFRKEVFHLPDFQTGRGVSAMLPIKISFVICGITVKIELCQSAAQKKESEKQNRHSAK